MEFLKRGYQAFILQYAVLEDGETQALLPYPQMDLAKAVAYVKEHQEVWNVDGEQITILGCSADYDERRSCESTCSGMAGYCV